MGCGASKESGGYNGSTTEKMPVEDKAKVMKATEAAAEPQKKGYVYGFFDLKDAKRFKEEYSPAAEPSLVPYGGKFIMKHALVPEMAAKMGMKESKGFGNTGQMAFMLEFPDFEKAMGWFTGPEYAAVTALRDEVSDFRMNVVEGEPIAPGSGLVVGFFDLKDGKRFKEEYSPAAEPSLDPYGGKFVIKHALVPEMAAKMGMKESKGFGATGQMAFVLSFPNFEKAMGWFTGPEYAAVTGLRDEVSDFRMNVVETMPPQKKGYVYGFFDLKDGKRFKEEYSPAAEPSLVPYGGKFIMKHALVPEMAAKMGMKESKGFGNTGQMAFMLEFPDFEKAMGWFTGPEYAAVTALRDEVSDFRMNVVEGEPIAPGSGLVVGFFDLKDGKRFKEEYSPAAEPSLDPYGGKFVIKHALVPEMAAKMGMKESKGFGATGQMAFVLSFPNFEKAMGWFTGPEYAAVTGLRDEVSDFRMNVVETMPPQKKGYVYGFFDLKDGKRFKEEYSPAAEPSLVPYGGKFIMKHALVPEMAAKMGMKESKGFGNTGQMAFMLEFPDFEKAMGWFTGPEYAAVTALRDEVSDFRMNVVEGEPIAPGSGLVVGFFDLKDGKRFKEEYSPAAEPSLDPYGGKFVIKHALVPEMAAKMGMKESKGFGATGQMAFVLSFPNFEKAMGWFTGPEYAAVTGLRDEVSDFRMNVVEVMP